jgi:hypothetical protein
MASSNCHQLPLRARTARALFRRIILWLVGIPCLQAHIVHAAPITFRFDAEIFDVPAGNPFDLPLTFQVGDVILGKFTFDPNLALPLDDKSIASHQPYSLEFQINGNVVGSSGFRLEVFDNTAFDDSTYPESLDAMTLGCNEPLCVPELLSLPEGEPFRVRSRMQVVGIDSILTAPQISVDPMVWNALTLERRINLNFDNQGPGAMGFQATVGAFIIVPEPHNAQIALSAIFALSFFYCTAAFRRSWRKHPRTLTSELSSPIRPI